MNFRKILCVFWSWFFTIFYEMLHINVQHKSTYVFLFSIVSLLSRTAIARHLLAAFLAMPAVASSSARFSLIIARSCFALQSRLRVAVADVALQSRMQPNCFILIFDHCVSTLVLCWHFPRKPDVLCLPCTFCKKPLAGGDDFRPMTR